MTTFILGAVAFILMAVVCVLIGIMLGVHEHEKHCLKSAADGETIFINRRPYRVTKAEVVVSQKESEQT